MSQQNKLKKSEIVLISTVVMIILYFSYYEFVYRTNLEEYFEAEGIQIEDLHISEITVTFFPFENNSSSVTLTDEKEIEKVLAEISSLKLKKHRLSELRMNILKHSGSRLVNKPNCDQKLSIFAYNQDRTQTYGIDLFRGKQLDVTRYSGKKDMTFSYFEIMGDYYEYVKSNY